MEWTVSVDVVAAQNAVTLPYDKLATETIIALEEDPKVLAPATRANEKRRTVGATFCVMADSVEQAAALGLERLTAAVRRAGVQCLEGATVEVVSCDHDEAADEDDAGAR